MYCKKNVHPGELEKENRQAVMKSWQEAQGCRDLGGEGGGANNHVAESHSNGYHKPLTLNSVYTLTSPSAVSLKAQFPPGTLT